MFSRNEPRWVCLGLDSAASGLREHGDWFAPWTRLVVDTAQELIYVDF